jgi:hypothetical protein
MSEVATEEKHAQTKKEKTKAEKQSEHVARIKRNLAASLIGIFAGILSYWSGGIPNAAGVQANGFLAFMLMLTGVVLQKYLFMFMGMDTSKLGAKDWFYQGFMTFAFWFMTWTILLTSLSPVLK